MRTLRVLMGSMLVVTSSPSLAAAQPAPAAGSGEIEIGGPSPAVPAPAEAPKSQDAKPPESPVASAPELSSDTHTMIRVRLDGPAGARLEQDLDSIHHSDWQTICEAPCEARVDSAFDYRVAGGLMKASKDFALRAPDGGHEVLRVDAASKLWFAVGGVGIGAGAGTFGFAASVLLSSPLLSSSLGGPGLTTDQLDGLLLLGGIGAAVAIGGYALMRAHRSTTVSQDVGASVATPGAPSAGGAPSLSWKAVPSWASVPSTAVVPVVRLSF
jgi:hypothetical protein